MAELKALTATPSPTKEAFLGAGKKVDTTKKRPQVKKLSDNSGRYIKVGLYGDAGSGKTFTIADLVEKFNLKVLILSTDVGGDGLSTVVAELHKRGRIDLADTNVFQITLATYEQFVEFTENPQLCFPEIYEVGIDLLFWDGFSGFQQYQMLEYVDGLDTIIAKDGSVITQKYWGEVRAATIKNLNRFLYMHNKRTGKMWHKFVTMLADDKGNEESLAQAVGEAERQKVKKDVKAPLIQSGASKLIPPAFDIFIRTATKREDTGTTDPAGKKIFRTVYVYHVEPNEKQKAKVRGVEFPPTIPGNMGEVWQRLVDAYLVKPEQINLEVVEAA